ncbi:MAG: APC family permease [Acidobacteriota bacterium]
MNQRPALKRGIRFRDLVLFYVISTFSVRWTALAAAAGPSILVIWIAALACFFVPLAASVMELSSRHPEEGGIYVWSREAFGDFAGFIAAWTYWMSNLPYFPGVLYFGAASALFAFGPQARHLAGDPLYYVLFSVAALGAITLLNIGGITLGKWFNNISALGSLVPMVLLVGLAAVSVRHYGAATHFTVASFVPHWSLGNAIFWSSVFFAFGGVESGSSMGDEIENPRRNIPAAIVLGGALLALCYIAGTSSLLVALPSTAVAGPDGFVHAIAILGARFHLAWIIAPVALLVALNAVGGAAAYLSATSRLPFVAGIDHYLPAAFGSIHPRYRTPWVAIGIYGLAGIAVALLGQAGTTVRGAYEVMVSMGVLSYFVPYLFLFGAMIRLQARAIGPEVRRVPGGKPVAIVLASVGLISTSLTIVLSAIPAQDEPHKLLAVVKVVGGALLLIGAGVTVFLLESARSRKTLQPR